MAINVHYQPPMEMLSQAAYRAGLGAYQQRQQQLAMQQQEAAIAQAQRQQQLALQARGQDFEMQRALQNDQLRREMAAVDAMERQQQFAQNEMRNQAYLEQLRQNDPQLRANLQWQQQSSENLDKMASEFEAVMSKKTLNEPGAALRQKLVGDLRQIRSMRNKMLPNQYAEAMQKWFKSVDESGIENYEEFAPTPDEMRQQRSVQINEHNIMTFDENGRPSVQRLQTPPAPKSDASIVTDDGAPVPFDQFVRNNYGELRKMKAEARKAIIEERKLQQGDEITIKPPTTEEIMKRVREEYEADLQAIGGQQPQPQSAASAPQAATQPPTAAATQAPVQRMSFDQWAAEDPARFERDLKSVMQKISVQKSMNGWGTDVSREEGIAVMRANYGDVELTHQGVSAVWLYENGKFIRVQ